MGVVTFTNDQSVHMFWTNDFKSEVIIKKKTTRSVCNLRYFLTQVIKRHFQYGNLISFFIFPEHRLSCKSNPDLSLYVLRQYAPCPDALCQCLDNPC